jgi:hypothetical protein
VIPFMQAVATTDTTDDAEIEISPRVIEDALAAADRSVTPAMLARFDAWAAEMAR